MKKIIPLILALGAILIGSGCERKSNVADRGEQEKTTSPERSNEQSRTGSQPGASPSPAGRTQ